MNKDENLEMDNARESEQRAVMSQITKDGVCPFCEENLEKYHKPPILFKTEKWIVTTNAWPYKMTKKHFLVISRDHVSHLAEVSMTGIQEISLVMNKLKNEFGLEYGTLLMRFGEMSKTGATVKHLHFQIIQSDPKDPEYKPEKGLWTRIG